MQRLMSASIPLSISKNANRVLFISINLQLFVPNQGCLRLDSLQYSLIKNQQILREIMIIAWLSLIHRFMK